ncbi:MAG: GDSL-type esterase/lipase family protein [Chloroflexota bacterium]|nr:GDSL-type esterase/lipase family protein [Chloroflexota bacterium]
MTRVLFLVVLTLVGCGSAGRSTPARTPTPTLFVTTTAPTITPARPTPAFRYVAIGASDAVGVGAADPRTGSWPARIAARLPAGSDYVNAAVSGSQAAQAAREQTPAAAGLRPQLVTVWLAVNDLNAGVPSTEYAAALRAVLEPLILKTDARIFVGTVPDLRTVPAYAGTDQSALLAKINAYNAAIQTLTVLFAGRVTAVDLFTGSAALVSTMTVSGDGFHPSDAGYALIADRFATAIAAAGIPLR